MKTLILTASLTLLILSCNKKNKCPDNWPEGFQYFETTNGSEAVCTTPLLKGWIKQNPSSNEATYSMEFTFQQGLADVFVFSNETEQFKSGDSFTLNNQQNSNLETIKVVVNTQYDESGLNPQYWACSAASMNITSFDENTNTISCNGSYTIYETGSSSDERSFDYELNDYVLNFNFH